MGHAISRGRNYITLEDIAIVIKTGLSSASIGRVRIFDLLLEHNGELLTSNICKELKVSSHTARRTMAELDALEIVDMETIGTYNNAESKIKLKDKFAWFLTPEFQKLREGFRPADYTKLKYRLNATESVQKIILQKLSPKHMMVTRVKIKLPSLRDRNNFDEQKMNNNNHNSSKQFHNLDNGTITNDKVNGTQSATIVSDDNHCPTSNHEQQLSSDIELKDNDENNFNTSERRKEDCRHVTVTPSHELTSRTLMDSAES